MLDLNQVYTASLVRGSKKIKELFISVENVYFWAKAGMFKLTGPQKPILPE
jgi:hypothetical protein